MCDTSEEEVDEEEDDEEEEKRIIIKSVSRYDFILLCMYY